MIYCFDLDGTLLTIEKDYQSAKPITERINKLRELADEKDSYIIIQTGRNKQWQQLTEYQLAIYGIPYNHLSVGDKCHADIYIDDKAINDKDYFK